MGKIHLIELIPLSNTFDDELLNLAINYQANESLTYNETDFPNSIFSTKERVLLSVREKNGKFYELNTNLEIIQNDRKSIKKGYVTSRSFPYYIEEEKSDLIKDSEAIKLFLNTCTVRREKLESAVKNYILGITNNDIEIISYIDKIKNSNGKIVFKRIYIERTFYLFAIIFQMVILNLISILILLLIQKLLYQIQRKCYCILLRKS